MLASVSVVWLALAAPEVLLVASRDGDAEKAAGALREALASDPRLSELPPVAIVDPTEGPVGDVEPAEDLLRRAEEAYAQLSAQAALDGIGQAQELLLPMAAQGSALTLLARSLRIRGRTQHFLQQPQAAHRSFASASFLDPGFSPDVASWPPQLRLAYADAASATRRAQTGRLSLKVAPPAARVWFDGQAQGLGSTTVETAPGEHLVVATCPGHRSFGGLVNVDGGGKLTQASVFLEPQAEEPFRPKALALALGAFGSQEEEAVTRQALALAKADYLVLVRQRDDSSMAAWLFNSDGTRVGAATDLVPPEAAAAILRGYLFPAPEPPLATEAWYENWGVWAVAGGALVAGGTLALVYGLSAASDDRVTLVLGRGQ